MLPGTIFRQIVVVILQTSTPTILSSPLQIETGGPSVTHQSVSLDGEWKGTTSQSAAIGLKIAEGKIIHVQFDYTIPGNGCFHVRGEAGAMIALDTLRNSVETTWTIPRLAPPVSNGRFHVERMQTSGGPSAAPIYLINGAVEKDGSMTGTLELIALASPGEKPCQATTKATWKVTRSPVKTP